MIQDFLPQGSLISYAGEPGVGKSVFMMHLAMCLATGTAPLGGLFPANPEGPVSVLYFDQENSRPDHFQYLKWAWEGLGRPDISTLSRYLWVPHFELGGADWDDKVAEWIEKVQPRAILYDTKSPSFNTQDENDNSEASKTISTLRELALLTDKPASQIVMMHEKTRSDTSGRRHIRGAKAWEGATDGIVFHTKKGRQREDGLTMTQLEPSKVRAFGLRKPVDIDPHWGKNKSGLILKGKFRVAGKPTKKKDEEENVDE